MAWTNQDLEEIERAIATGELTVRFGDRLVTYRSMDELLAARVAIKRDLYAQARGPSRASYSVARFD